MIEKLLKEIEAKKSAFVTELDKVKTEIDLLQLKHHYTGRKRGILADLMKRLREVPADDKSLVGKKINELKTLIDEGMTEKELLLKGQQRVEKDFSLPGIDVPVGNEHLLAIVQRQIEDTFMNMGYIIAYGPEVESEYYNFAALNFQENHPARDEQDTFFIKGFPETILRTHTSPVQIRYMEENEPPIKIISPGRVFRKDEPDATHTPVFTQVEGLLVDREINFSHLKGTLELFIKSLFGEDIKLRFRPGYFPFTEPSAEVDISCFLCFGKNPGCKICKGTGWLEILGSGMVHPQVLLNCDIDPEIYSGFAFGMGVERVTLFKYGINDLRIFYDNDLRFIRQFG